MIDSSERCGLGRRTDDQLAARQALSDIVVGLALEIERDASGHPRAKGLAGGALELHRDRVVGEPA